MPNFDVRCDACGFESEEIISAKDVSDEWRGICERCEKPHVRRVYINAPAFRVGGEGSPRSVGAMRRSYDERFVKSGELDQIRHKHGDAFDDSLRAGAIGRIKGEKKDHWDKD